MTKKYKVGLYKPAFDSGIASVAIRFILIRIL